MAKDDKPIDVSSTKREQSSPVDIDRTRSAHALRETPSVSPIASRSPSGARG
jgi:hypothetical protein